MRVLHVSDLHLGRDLSGISRRGEHLALMLELVSLADAHSIDLTVIAGDIFDVVNPPAWAEDAFYDLLDGLAAGGRRAVVVIAGNHDHGIRLAAAEPLARRTGIWLCGDHEAVPGAFCEDGKVQLEPLGKGAVLIHSADRQRRVAVGALPFVSEARLVPLQRAEIVSELEVRDAYADALAEAFAARKALLPAGVPHLLMGHCWVTGGVDDGSERTYRVGNLTDLRAASLPEADYIALGHLHRPQLVPGAPGPGPVIYSGSPLAWSRSDAGQEKRAVVVELTAPGQTQLHSVPLLSGRPMRLWTVRSPTELAERVQKEAADRPFVELTLDYGRALTRDELAGVHRMGVSFIKIVSVFERGRFDDEEALGQDDDLPDEDVIGNFFAELDHSALVVRQLTSDVLTLLRREFPPRPAGAFDEDEA